MNGWLISLILFTPLIGALLVLVTPRENERAIKVGATALSTLPLGLSILMWFGYDRQLGGMQFVQQMDWIPSLKVTYHVGVGALPLIVSHTVCIDPSSRGTATASTARATARRTRNRDREAARARAPPSRR